MIRISLIIIYINTHMTKTLAPPKPKYSRHFSSLKQFLRSLLPKLMSLHISILLPLFSQNNAILLTSLAPKMWSSPLTPFVHISHLLFHIFDSFLLRGNPRGFDLCFFLYVQLCSLMIISESSYKQTFQFQLYVLVRISESFYSNFFWRAGEYFELG